MKIKHQLSIATLLMAGVFVTGCSQQQVAGGSQYSGGSQSTGSQQVSGGSQVAGSSQSGSQQQVEGAAPVVAEPVVAPAPAPVMAPMVDPLAHNHPEAPACAKTRSHSHAAPSSSHRHNYACQQAAAKPQVDVRALQMKLQAKGYYKGPIDGVVGPSTRDALQRFMKR